MGVCQTLVVAADGGGYNEGETGGNLMLTENEYDRSRRSLRPWSGELGGGDTGEDDPEEIGDKVGDEAWALERGVVDGEDDTPITFSGLRRASPHRALEC
ncbi:hypothetical protein BGW42_004991 [Actinomortierella wolfii]|nr:hypothetical protein BGW42_004991 [Actinomortierella wolfii]